MKKFLILGALFVLPVFASAHLSISTSSSLPDAKVGEYYSVQINTSGVDASNGFYWTVDGGAAAFPVPGLGLSSPYGSSISIKGTPAKVYYNGIEQTSPYTFDFSLTVSSGSDTETKHFSLTVNPDLSNPTITSINTAWGGTPRPGDLVDVFGSHFSSGAGISINGSAEVYAGIAKYVNSGLINFKIPSNLSAGSHSVEVYLPISTGGALVSNKYTLKIAAAETPTTPSVTTTTVAPPTTNTTQTTAPAAPQTVNLTEEQKLSMIQHLQQLLTQLIQQLIQILQKQ